MVREVNQNLRKPAYISYNSSMQGLARSHTLSHEEEIFQKMFSPRGLKLADPYLKEEKNILNNYILKNSDKIKNIIVIGAGPLRYLEIAHNKNYIAIDKYLNLFLDKRPETSIKDLKNIKLINKAFEDVEINELPTNNCLYIFTFNVISYIDNPESSIRKIIDKDNIIFISGWSKNCHILMSNYLEYIYQDSSYLKNSTSFVDPHKMALSDVNTIKTIEKYDGIFTKSISIHT